MPVSEENFRRAFIGSLVKLCVASTDTIPYDLVDVTERGDRTEVTLDLKYPYIYIRDDKDLGKVGRIRITVRTEEVRGE